MSNWEEKTLKELVEVDPEQLPSSTDVDYSFFYLDISSVSLGNVNFPIHSIRFKDAPSRARKILKDNDILMSTVRPNLKAFALFRKRSKSNFIASTGFAVLRSGPNVEIGFIYHSLFSNEIEKQIEALVVGSNYPAINSSDVRNLKINIPSFPTQRKIAHILTTCDTVIEQTQSAIAKYKAIKQGLLHDLFTRGLDANGKLRPSYQQSPELYKESELGMIPKEWELKRLEEIATMKSGDGITSKNINDNGDFPVYGGNGLRGFTTTFTHEGNYVLIGRQGALCGNITRVSNKFFASEHAVVVTVNKDIDVDWLSQKLDYMNLNQYSEASAQPGLAVAKILRLYITKPQHNEQIEIGKRLLALDNKMNAEETLLQKYQSIKHGLMGDLLGGRKEVKTN